MIGDNVIEIIDDYLSPDIHNDIYNYWTGNYDKGDIQNSCSWAFTSGINRAGDGDYGQYVHLVFAGHTILNNSFYNLKPIIDKENMTAISRIKANATSRTEKVVVFDWAFHCDHGPDMENMITAIYYINSNNGYTLFEDGTKVESVANRFVKFPATMVHTGTTCTNDYRRILVNFNYFQK